ncbi:MAG TPA: sigma-70 family RNA polymerase sigma factor [Thermoanaerobaculia bacterium]|nr:sigma-70 family RNA polymerase sigma factor [Thermoanaerobaculia bacterium]
MLERNALEITLARSPDESDGAAKDVSAPSAATDDRAQTAMLVTEEPLPQTAPDVGALYTEHRILLLHIACRKFRIPDSDAESLLQEVFLSYMQVGTQIRDVRSWLVAAMCNASRHYWRSHARTESLPPNIGERSDPDSHGLAEMFAMQLTVRRALEYLQPRCRETLYLHYFEGRSASDVAKEMDTTNRYAEKLIHNCLKRAREIYLTLTAVKR